MNTKICTSIKQSKKLIELGIDVNTADMWWNQDEEYPRFIKSYHMYLGLKVPPVPIWTLSALMMMMPQNINGYGLELRRLDSIYCCVYSDFNGGDLFWSNGDTPVDAAYEMVVLLLINKKL